MPERCEGRGVPGGGVNGEFMHAHMLALASIDVRGTLQARCATQRYAPHMYSSRLPHAHELSSSTHIMRLSDRAAANTMSCSSME